MNRETIIAILAYAFTLAMFAASLYIFLVGISAVQGEREEHRRIHGSISAPAQVSGVRVVTK